MGQTCESLAHETKYSQVTLTSRGWFKSSSLAILAVIMLVNIPSAHWSQSCRLSRQRDSVRGATTEVSFLSHMSLYLPMPGTSNFLKPHPSHLSFPGWECVKSNYILFACEHEKRDECVCHMCNAWDLTVLVLPLSSSDGYKLFTGGCHTVKRFLELPLLWHSAALRRASPQSKELVHWVIRS